MFVQALIGKVSDATTVRRTWERWGEELRAGAAGFLGSTAGIGEDGTFVAVFPRDVGIWSYAAATLVILIGILFRRF